MKEYIRKEVKLKAKDEFCEVLGLKSVISTLDICTK